MQRAHMVNTEELRFGQIDTVRDLFPVLDFCDSDNDKQDYPDYARLSEDFPE